MEALNLTTEGIKAIILNVTQEEMRLQKVAECKKYGTFMSHLSRNGLETMFWVPFASVFVLLVLASSSHQKSERTYIHGKNHPEEEESIKAKQRRWRIAALLFTTIAALMVIALVVLEALAGCALTYCLKHKLIWFYWGMWTLTQVGSLVAIIGITVHQFACLGEHSTPPWNVALGTPILVITGSAHIAGAWISKKYKERRYPGEASSVKDTYSTNEASSLFITQKANGGVIISYHGDLKDRQEVPGEKILGRSNNGGYIIDMPPSIALTAAGEADTLSKVLRPQSGVSFSVTVGPPTSSSSLNQQAISLGNSTEHV